MPTIALVDDDRDILDLVTLILESEGYHVVSYCDGAAALNGFKTNRPDLAILDVKMPRMDGVELLRRLRQKSDIPIIFLTSMLDEIDELIGLKSGADDFIRKPSHSVCLLSGLRLCCGGVRSGMLAVKARPTPTCWNADSFAWTENGTPAPGRASA